jgi:hypothetical protein
MKKAISKYTRNNRVQIEPEYSEPSVVIVEDPTLGCSGPLWIRGGRIKACRARILEEKEEEDRIAWWYPMSPAILV